ncbi:uncharacterized protein LOC118284688 isoform X2 [Scophthalmus maximus]|uniref:uncharacterized protein LOC118284688 isoform X2 n=1 Tax=Scophthalmus maximus TaxID=52904 RepID=UPI0015E0E3DC|nr:uncharacterized protein LOC118284688 isoform X2 [Scophthalmus maximus]
MMCKYRRIVEDQNVQVQERTPLSRFHSPPVLPLPATGHTSFSCSDDRPTEFSFTSSAADSALHSADLSFTCQLPPAAVSEQRERRAGRTFPYSSQEFPAWDASLAQFCSERRRCRSWMEIIPRAKLQVFPAVTGGNEATLTFGHVPGTSAVTGCSLLSLKAHVPAANMEGTGLMTCIAVSHQGAIGMIWLHILRAVMWAVVCS